MRHALIFVLVAGLAVPALLAGAQDASPPAAGKASPGTCKSCHSAPAVGNQWDAWAKSDHAKSFESLAGPAAAAVAKQAGVEGDPQKAAACLECHAPMEHKRSMGVSCHACHGAGHDYAGVCGEDFAEAVSKGMRLSDERDCLKCHRPSKAHPDLEFDFVIDGEDVAHPVPAKKDPDAELFSTKGLYTKWEVFTEKDGLPHHMVFGATPHGDDVWFATEHGVALLRDGKFQVWQEKDGLPHAAVTQVAVDEETGEVWASTLAGIASFDGKKWTAYTQANSKLINNCAFGIDLFEEDVWVATFDGISRYDRKTREWKSYYLDNAPLEEVWIYGLEADHEKVNFAVWGGGLVEYYPADDYWEAHHDPDGSFELDMIQNDGVVSQMITAASYANGWTWVGSYFGMAAYDGRNWIENDMDNSGILSNFINFVKARRHEGWFATDRGISCYDVKKERWVNYRRLDGPGDYGEITILSRDGKKRRSVRMKGAIPFNFVWGIAFQGEDIWVCTSNGVARGSY